MPVAIVVSSLVIIAATFFNQWAFMRYSLKPEWDWRRKGPVLIATAFCVVICALVFRFVGQLHGEALGKAIVAPVLIPMLGSILIVIIRSTRQRNRALRAIKELEDFNP